MSEKTLQIEPLMIDTKEAAKMIGISRGHFLVLEKTGRIGPEPLRLGVRVLWRLSDLRDFVQRGMPCRRDWMAMQSMQKTG